MTRKSDYAFWTFVMLACLAGATTVLNVTRTYSATSTNSEIYKQLDLFGDVLERVRSDYVDKPDDAMLIDSAINGMLAALDPHSAYLNPKNYRDMQVQTRGEFGGLGIEVTMEQGSGVVKVVSPIDDTPAAKAGLQTNDLITHLDGEQIVGLTLEQAVDKMRGPVNTPITLTIVRKGKDDPFDVKIVRDVIRINAVKARAEGDVIYVKISTFNEQTHANLVKQVDALKKTVKNLKGYVHRSARQSRRPARPGDRRFRRLPRQGSDRAHQGPGPGGDAARQRASRRHHRRQAGHRAHQRRLGVGLRDRGRRAAGPQARHGHRHALVRQRLRADHHPARRRRQQRRDPPDDGALLHAVGPLDPGQGHRSGRHRRAGAAA